MLGAGWTVQEVPPAQEPLVAVDDRDALAVEDEKVLLDRLAVIAAVRLARLHDLDVHACVREPIPARLEVQDGRTT